MTDDKRRPRPSGRPLPPDPPPEVFKRTEEQRQAAQARLDAEVAAMKARGVPSDLGVGAPVPDRGDTSGPIEDEVDRLREKAETWQAERRGLICWRSIYPVVPDGFLERQLASGRVLAGRLACIAAGARDRCPYKHEHPTCLYERAEALRERTAANLTIGLGTEVEDEHKLVLRAVDLDNPVELRDTDPLQVVRRWLGGLGGKVPVVDAAQFDPLSGELRNAECIELAGTERLLVLGGNPGRGKTVAGVYAIARKAGLYVLDYQLGRPFDVDKAAGAAGVVVVDQLQATDADEAKRAARRLDEIVIRRCAAGRKTILIGNLDWQMFAARFGSTAVDKGKRVIKHAGNIAERCSQMGVFVVFGGASMRAT